MAKKSGSDALGIVVIAIIAFIVWVVSAVIDGIKFVNQSLLQFASSPEGLIALYFVLLASVSFVVGYFIKKGVRKKAQELAEKEAEHYERVARYEFEVQEKVDTEIGEQKAWLRSERYDFNDSMQRSQKAVQRLVDNSYKFKVKTLLASVSLKNQATKYDQLKKEKDKYSDLRKSMDYLGIDDNSNWADVVKQFYDKISLLEAAQDEKDAQAELKRQMREEKQRQDELERRQLEAEEEENRLAEQQRVIEEALAQAEGQYKEELERQRSELEQQIADVHAQYERAKSMAQLTKQGHVYVTSNIGSFGEQVFKIGMTRRLEPMDRIKELGGASVPFEFDVHAMISCDDAPALENALHTELNKYRMNKINLRKEFFKVDLQQIIDAVERNHGTVEYVADPVALQYYRSLELEDDVAA